MGALHQYPGSPALSTVRRITVGGKVVRIEVIAADATAESTAEPITITVPIHLCRRGNEIDIRPAGNTEGLRPTQPDRTLVRGMIRAYQWRTKLESGEFPSLEALARAEKRSSTYLSTLLQLAFLPPDLTEAILDGRQSNVWTLAKIRSTQVPLDWEFAARHPRAVLTASPQSSTIFRHQRKRTRKHAGSLRKRLSAPEQEHFYRYLRGKNSTPAKIDLLPGLSGGEGGIRTHESADRNH
jgi:hypothetical protein